MLVARDGLTRGRGLGLPGSDLTFTATQPSPSPNVLRCPTGSVREAWGSLCNRLSILLGRPLGTMNSYANYSGAKAMIPIVLSQGLGKDVFRQVTNGRDLLS